MSYEELKSQCPVSSLPPESPVRAAFLIRYICNMRYISFLQHPTIGGLAARCFRNWQKTRGVSTGRGGGEVRPWLVIAAENCLTGYIIICGTCHVTYHTLMFRNVPKPTLVLHEHLPDLVICRHSCPASLFLCYPHASSLLRHTAGREVSW